MSSLDESLEEVLDSVVRLLEAQKKTGGTLTDVNKIIRGDRSNPTPDTPCIWVFSETAQVENITALQEKWTLPVALVAVVNKYDEDEGYREATRLAARARSAVIKERRLLDVENNPLSMVQDVKGGRFEASAPWHREKTLYSAIAVINVIFRTME